MLYKIIERLKGRNPNWLTSLLHIRDMTHNLPKHLNLGDDEVTFLSYMLMPMELDYIHVRDVSLNSDMNMLASKYIGKPVDGCAGNFLLECDFISAQTFTSCHSSKEADLSVTKIGQCILFNNREKYLNDNTDAYVASLRKSDVLALQGSLLSNQLLSHIKEKLFRYSLMWKHVPYELNLDKEETHYLHDFFALLHRLGEPKVLITGIVNENDWDYLVQHYTDKRAGHTVIDKVNSSDFRLAKKGDAKSLAKIAGCILFSNLSRYQKKDEWFRKVDK